MEISLLIKGRRKGYYCLDMAVVRADRAILEEGRRAGGVIVQLNISE